MENKQLWSYQFELLKTAMAYGRIKIRFVSAGGDADSVSSPHDTVPNGTTKDVNAARIVPRHVLSP